jgi:hypothetical protein
MISLGTAPIELLGSGARLMGRTATQPPRSPAVRCWENPVRPRGGVFFFCAAKRLTSHARFRRRFLENDGARCSPAVWKPAPNEGDDADLPRLNCWPASIYPLIIQRKNSEDARLILGKAANP